MDTKSDWGPSYIVSGTRETTFPLRQLNRTRSPCSPSQSWPCLIIIHNPYWIFKRANNFLLGHSIKVGFGKLIITLIQISALNPKSRHFVTLATPRIVSVRRAKVFIWRKVVPPARVTLQRPAEARQLAHPSCLVSLPRRVCDPIVSSWLNFAKKNKWNVILVRVTRGKGCLRYPRP